MLIQNMRNCAHLQGKTFFSLDGTPFYQTFPLLFDVPQKITLEDLNGSKSTLGEKSAERSRSVNSMQTTTQETTNVAVYEVLNTKEGIAPAALACVCMQY